MHLKVELAGSLSSNEDFTEDDYKEAKRIIVRQLRAELGCRVFVDIVKEVK